MDLLFFLAKAAAAVYAFRFAADPYEASCGKTKTEDADSPTLTVSDAMEKQSHDRSIRGFCFCVGGKWEIYNISPTNFRSAFVEMGSDSNGQAVVTQSRYRGDHLLSFRSLFQLVDASSNPQSRNMGPFSLM